MAASAVVSSILPVSFLAKQTENMRCRDNAMSGAFFHVFLFQIYEIFLSEMIKDNIYLNE